MLLCEAVGGGVAALFFKYDPLAAFAAGFMSHFVLDAVPHWHYHMRSIRRNGNPMDNYWIFDATFLRDLFFIGIDAGAGIVLTLCAAYALPPDQQLAIVFGAIGGIMPDALQLLYSMFRNSPLRHLQRFHVWVHQGRHLNDQLLLGIGSQLFILAGLFFVLQFAAGG